MRGIQLCGRWRSSSGQSLLETALILPLILLAVMNAINFGYYFIVALHLASAPREGVEYAIQGDLAPSGPPSLALPGPATTNTTISYLTYQDMSTLSGSSTTAVNVCSDSVGIANGNGLNNPGATNQSAPCQSYGSTANPAFATAAPSDPESPLFILQRVDVQYQVTPLIGAMSFKIGGVNLGLLTPNLTFHRQVTMRLIN